MSRALISVLAVCFVFTATAFAGVPDPDQSYVTLDNNGEGMTTCPAGDASTYQYINVYAHRADGSPIEGITEDNFHFTVTGSGSGCCVITAVDAETDVNGHIRFQAQGSCTITYGQVQINVTIYAIVVNDTDYLTCNTFDYDNNGVVDPIDFGQFASDFNTTAQRSDFDWNGIVDPIDFGQFAAHFTHF